MTEPQPNGKRILVVDDGMTTRLYYRSVFEAAGFTVDEAANGLEGLERALVETFDLLVVDVNMPKMDGYTMIERLRGDSAGQTVPIVTISTEAGAGDADRALEAGANLYLVKPAAPAALRRYAALMTGVVA
jgi:two-component system chemotaxis response regulator CheY